MRLALNKEWAVGARIGGGGFGAVREAEDAVGERAAVKVVPKAPGTEREMLCMDRDGVRNVVPAIDSGEHEDQWVLVMSMCPSPATIRSMRPSCPARAISVSASTSVEKNTTGTVPSRAARPRTSTGVGGPSVPGRRSPVRARRADVDS